MQASNIEINHKSVKEIVAEDPATTHIYFRRDDSVLVDIPLGHVDMTIKNHPSWLVEGGAHPTLPLATIGSPKPEELPILPPKPSEEKVSKPARKKAPAKPKAKKA